MALLTAMPERRRDRHAGPSANRFSRVSPTTAAPRGQWNLVMGWSGRRTLRSASSQHRRLHSGPAVLLRPSVLTLAQLEAACSQPVLSPEELGSGARASGTRWNPLRAECQGGADGRRSDQARWTCWAVMRPHRDHPHHRAHSVRTVAIRRMPDDALATPRNSCLRCCVTLTRSEQSG
jgi:L-threonylcarbamoyladenylate synthase